MQTSHQSLSLMFNLNPKHLIDISMQIADMAEF